MRSEYYKRKNWCDAKDGLGVWRMGRVKQRLDQFITVHFEGWSEKWKKVYCVHSSLIAPFRMNSKGYTGQTKVALREWDFSEENLKLHQMKIRMLIRNGFGGFSPENLTSFIRGDLFVLIDCLLTYTYSNPSSDIPKVVEFLYEITEMILKWLEKAPEYFSELKPEIDAYLRDSQSSVYKLVYELLEMLLSLFGLVTRTKRFFEKYESIVRDGINIIQEFINKQGIQYLSKILYSPIPIQDIWSFIAVFPEVFQVVESNSIREYLVEFLDALTHRIQNLSVDEVDYVLSDKPLLDLFMDNIERLLIDIYSNQQRNNILATYRNKLRINTGSGNSSREVSFVRAPETPRARIAKAPQKQTELNENSILELRELIETKHEECIDTLFRKVSELTIVRESQPQDYKLEQVFFKKSSCDEQELAVLGAIQTMMEENNTKEALKLIKWRKNILKVAEMSGWEMAEDIARKTLHALTITASDFLVPNGRHSMVESLEFSDKSDSLSN